MMLYPSIMELMKKAESRYSLVIAASKRAREISEEAEKEKRSLSGAKSITEAVDEIYKGDIEIVENHEAELDKRAMLESTMSDKMEHQLATDEEIESEEEEYGDDEDDVIDDMEDEQDETKELYDI